MEQQLDSNSWAIIGYEGERRGDKEQGGALLQCFSDFLLKQYTTIIREFSLRHLL